MSDFLIRRGDDFRRDYGRLGELRALLSPNVHIMALTATATRLSRGKILQSLRMVTPIIVNVSPHKKNIVYTVLPKPELKDFISCIVEGLKTLRVNMPRTIIFCRRYKECAEMYSAFEEMLGKEFTEPPNLVKYRLVDMYTKCTEATIKAEVVSEFSKQDGSLRVIIGTIAFGMGLDCPDIRQVFHWGGSSDIESYIQETGRGGRDGFTSNAVLFHAKADERHMSPAMVDYCNEKVCRREMLFAEFDGFESLEKPCSSCLCFDICGLKCVCRNSIFPCSVNYAFYFS